MDFLAVLTAGMEEEKSKLQNDIARLEERLKRITNDASLPSSPTWSWEASYAKFADIDGDTKEDLEAQLKLAKSNLSRLKEKVQASDHKSCSHRHPCLCSQNRSREVEIMSMTIRERIDKMKEFKLQGNTLFNNNKHSEALEQYQRSLIYYEYCFDAVNDDKRELEHVRLHCLLNAAASALHLESYKQCIEFCNEALEIDNTNPKAFFRRAKAARFLNRYACAKRDLGRAIELTKNGRKCADLRREMTLLQQSEEQYEKATLEFAQRAIGGSG